MDPPRPSLEALRAKYEAQARGSIPRPSTVADLVAAWLSHCKATYPARIGKRSSTFSNARDAAKAVICLYAHAPVASIGPVQLQAVRLYMIDSGLSRRTINDRIARIRRMYRWARDRGWIEQATVDALCIEGLRKGRSKAVERPKRKAVPIEDVVRTLRDTRLSPVVKDMVRVQLRTGMRPAEICELVGREIDTSGNPWVFQPEHHKMAWLDRERTVLIGERAQLALLPYLNDGPIFLTRRGTPYRVDSYSQEIRRACERQGIPRWTPQQLRKRAGTEAAKQGISVAQELLGHANERTTRAHYSDVTHSAETLRFVADFG